ncbi:tRNA 2-thiouridine(34) synthase MnmA, partial [Patescibacteria group bacterium]|nr:tRNA 2-thiouridine(34) synthase MnmA [Patescibacteria group bacterium]
MVKNGNKKVLVAMSGGVDSSVAAYLLASEGYDLIGIHMKFYSETEELDSNKHLVKEDNKCCSIESSEDVRNICNRLGIPFYVLNFREEFKENIVEYFVSSLKKGITPNPCIMCNRDIKFGLLFDKMKELNASYIATGHYARVVNENGKYLLKRALDSYQDQSYFLCNINREVLPHLIFPLGEIENKDRVREIAYNNGLLRVSSKKDSQDICFVANNDTKEFIKKNVLKNVTD